MCRATAETDRPEIALRGEDDGVAVNGGIAVETGVRARLRIRGFGGEERGGERKRRAHKSSAEDRDGLHSMRHLCLYSRQCRQIVSPFMQLANCRKGSCGDHPEIESVVAADGHSLAPNGAFQSLPRKVFLW